MSNQGKNKIAARAIAASLVVAGTLAGASQGMAMENNRENSFEPNGFSRELSDVPDRVSSVNLLVEETSKVDDRDIHIIDEFEIQNEALKQKLRAFSATFAMGPEKINSEFLQKWEKERLESLQEIERVFEQWMENIRLVPQTLYQVLEENEKSFKKTNLRIEKNKLQIQKYEKVLKENKLEVVKSELTGQKRAEALEQLRMINQETKQLLENDEQLSENLRFDIQQTKNLFINHGQRQEKAEQIFEEYRLMIKMLHSK